MLFSHPGDFTPVCTTELAEISQRYVLSSRNSSFNSAVSEDLWTDDNDHGGWNRWSETRLPEFVKRNVKVIGISADSLQTHFEWIEDIIEIASKRAPTCVEYPIVCF